VAARGALYAIPTLASDRTVVVIARLAVGDTLTVAEACSVASVAPVAVIVTGVLTVTWGAVNFPLLEIVPAVADQTTAVFEVPVTLALNCSTPCEAIVALLGDSVIRSVGLPPELEAETSIWTAIVPRSVCGGSETSKLKL